MKPIIFIDTEVSETDNKAYDFGAVNENGEKLQMQFYTISFSKAIFSISSFTIRSKSQVTLYLALSGVF